MASSRWLSGLALGEADGAVQGTRSNTEMFHGCPRPTKTENPMLA